MLYLLNFKKENRRYEVITMVQKETLTFSEMKGESALKTRF